MTFTPKTLSDKIGVTSAGEPVSPPMLPPDEPKPAGEPKVGADADAPAQMPVVAPAPPT